MHEKPAVYLIVHCNSQRVYVGSTSNLSKRLSAHRLNLLRGTHPNRHLQAAWDLYGADAFEWKVLAYIDADKRIWLEQRAIDYFDATDPDKGFNKEAIAGVTRGALGRKWTVEQLARISQANKRAKPSHQPGDQCIHGHIKDGTYVKIRSNGSIKIRCQECERIGARERARRLAQRKKGVMPNES